jgi:HlyD family secretion protein
MINKILKKASQHKCISGVVVLALLIGGYYAYGAFFSTSGETRYVLSAVQKGTLINSISGSGQVSVSNQVDIKPKTSGDIVYMAVKDGQEIKQWGLIAQVDTADAERGVRDAETALQTAKLELEKLIAPVDALTLLQAENSLTQANESKQNAEDNLKKAYEDGFNTTANAFLNLPDVMSGLNDMLFSTTLSGGGQWNIDFYMDAVKSYDVKALQYREDAYTSYKKARVSYDKNFADYKSTSRFSDPAAIKSLINETYDSTKDIAEAVKSANNLIQFYKDKLIENNKRPAALSATHLSSLSSYTGTTNSILSNLLSIQGTIKDSEDGIVSAARSIEEKQLSLQKIKDGPDELDIRAKNIAIQQKEDALTTAKQTLADCFVRAPFDGIITKISVERGDQVSSGTVLATLITRQKFAEISLNEIDVAKVKIDQKVTLAFDAVPDLSITGKVGEIDALGTVSQGVVTYNVKIVFDTQDNRVKSGMSVSASIVTDIKTDVLLIPNSAVKSAGGVYYVEMLENVPALGSSNSAGIPSAIPPKRQAVEIGSSNDSMTEIVNGLKEGDQIVIRTVSASATTTQQGGSLFQMPGGNRNGGGVRN